METLGLSGLKTIVSDIKTLLQKTLQNKNGRRVSYHEDSSLKRIQSENKGKRKQQQQPNNFLWDNIKQFNILVIEVLEGQRKSGAEKWLINYWIKVNQICWENTAPKSRTNLT